MEEEPIVVGLDVGTAKVCSLVARVENGNNLRILGVGIEPTKGIRKGIVTDITAASECIARSIEKAERTSGFEINSAIVNLAGMQGCGGHFGTCDRPGRRLSRAGLRPGDCCTPQPRNCACDPARFQRGWSGRHPPTGWHAWFPHGSGSPHHHQCCFFNGKPATVHLQGRD